MITASIISGLSMGSMYALLALGFHITFIVSRTVNFAQGSAMMVGAVLGYTFCITLGLPWLLAAFLTLAVCAVYGLAIERFLVRPFHSRGSEAWLMATVAGGLLMILLADRVAEFLQRNRMYEVLGLFVLFVVGILLLTEGGHLADLHLFGHKIEAMSKATFYFVISVLVLTEIVQSRYQKKLLKAKAIGSSL